MSGLLAICDYSSYSSDSDDNCEKNNKASARLPVPDLTKVPIVNIRDAHVDDPQDHGGRIRNFPHVRGNWSTFIYINYPDVGPIFTLIDRIGKIVNCLGTFMRCDDLHVSLSRTIVLKYHWINSFIDTLQSMLMNVKRFNLQFDSIKVYCNEEKTRTFIALQVEHHSEKYLLNATEKVDEALEAFNLPKFYDTPSYHMSVLWIEGDKKEELSKFLDNILYALNGATEDNSVLFLKVNNINCNCGNKNFKFSLPY